MSSRQYAGQRMCAREPVGLGWREAAVLAVAGFLLVGCGGDGATAKPADVGAKALVPDACRLVDSGYVASLLGGRAGSPRSEGNERTERRRCTWVAPSPERPEVTLIINVAGEGRQRMTDERQRVAHARQIFERQTLGGQGACEVFQGADYRACWFLHRLSLSVSVLKEDLIVTIMLTLKAHQSMAKNELMERARSLADRGVAGL